MTALHVLYDGGCGLCRRCRGWFERQRALVPLHFLAFQEALLDPHFAPLAVLGPDREMIVVADTGEVWQGEAAWVMCLWALENYRGLAGRLASPVWRPLAKRVVTLISRNRHRLSDWIGRDDSCNERVCGSAGAHSS